jgi:hypothetical protein
MRSHRRTGWLIVGLASAVLTAGCAAATPTPAATASAVPSAPVVVASPTVMPTPTLSTTPSATPTATPLASLAASVIGTWTGVVREPAGLVEYWSARYDISPCASGEKCGTWSWEGPITKVEANRPWAVLGDTIRCSGPLTYKGEDRGEFAFVQATTDFKTAPGGTGCGVWIDHLKPTSNGGFDIGVGAGQSQLAHGTLTRADGSPAPSPSQ